MRTLKDTVGLVDLDTSYVRVACVCSSNLIRSPSWAYWLAGEGFNTRSAGIHIDSIQRINPYLYRWADAVVCLDTHVQAQVKHVFGQDLDKTILVEANVGRTYLDVDMRKQFESLLDSVVAKIMTQSDKTRAYNSSNYTT